MNGIWAVSVHRVLKGNGHRQGLNKARAAVAAKAAAINRTRCFLLIFRIVDLIRTQNLR